LVKLLAAYKLLEETVPSSSFELTAKVQKCFGIVFEPKHPSPFEPEINNSADGAFDRTATNRYVLLKKQIITTASLVVMKVF